MAVEFTFVPEPLLRLTALLFRVAALMLRGLLNHDEDAMLGWAHAGLLLEPE